MLGTTSGLIGQTEKPRSEEAVIPLKSPRSS